MAHGIRLAAYGIRLMAYGIRHMALYMAYGIRCIRYTAYGSARGSVWLSGSAAMCSSVQQCVRQCVGLCVAVFGSKRSGVRAMRAVYAAVCGSAIGSAWQCLAVYGSASVWRSLCVAVRSTYIYTQSHSQYVFRYRSGGNEPNMPCILPITDQYDELFIRITVNKKMLINMNLCELILCDVNAYEFECLK
jgi:hypothetical protein